MSADTDRDLHTKAARALGWRIVGFDGHTAVVVGDGRTFGWRPLYDDGEAFRLAVDLSMEFYIGDDEGAASYARVLSPQGPVPNCIEYHDDLGNCGDAHKATRRAILRAAAAFGATQ